MCTILSSDRKAKWIAEKSNQKSNTVNVIRWKASSDEQWALVNSGQVHCKI